MDYKIKEEFEDFQVNEVLDESIRSLEPTKNLLYILKKQNYTTERAVQQICRVLNIPRKFVGYAGAKDKQAVTTQHITIQSVNREKIDSLDLKDIELTFVGYAKDKLSIGELSGNDFIITVRNISINKKDFPTSFFVPNYFDDQRFSENNVDIGLHILRNEYKQAVELLIKTDKDNKELLEKHLQKQINDYVGALRRMPSKILLFFVHSVQSRLFNELLCEKIKQLGNYFIDDYSQGTLLFPKKPIEDSNRLDLPLIGWDSDDYNELLSKFNITARNFLVRSIPELTLEETKRRGFIEVNNFEIEYQENKLITKFRLGKGSYATIVLRQIFSSN